MENVNISSRRNGAMYAGDSVFRPEAVRVEEPASGFLWCRECERAFRYGQFRTDGPEQLCPFDDCEGDVPVGALPWEVRRGHHPAFPKYPMEGKMYTRGC